MSAPTDLHHNREQQLQLKNEELQKRFHDWTTTPQAHCLCLRFSCPGNCSMSSFQYSEASMPTGGTSFWLDSDPPSEKIFGADRLSLDDKPNRYARQSPDYYVRQFRTERHQVDKSASKRVRKDLTEENDKGERD
ncbi:hypothetical protein Slin14017_G102360 [Septoria linicola]|nr:hypothetical protein Slin14017_G102360 [Septoria linicola]